MYNYRRIIGVILLVAALATLTGWLIFRNATPPSEKKLMGLVGNFMMCLPENITAAQREEIRGIMDRFYKRAMSGKVHPQDIMEIQNDLEEYVRKGEIPKSELSEFVSKVGKATRRLDPDHQPPEN
jgi:hypothetical protein